MRRIMKNPAQSVVFAKKTSYQGWMKVYVNVNEDTAINIARRSAPEGWVTDTGAEWSEDYGCWLVDVYLPYRGGEG